MREATANPARTSGLSRSGSPGSAGICSSRHSKRPPTAASNGPGKVDAEATHAEKIDADDRQLDVRGRPGRSNAYSRTHPAHRGLAGARRRRASRCPRGRATDDSIVPIAEDREGAHAHGCSRRALRSPSTPARSRWTTDYLRGYGLPVPALRSMSRVTDEHGRRPSPCSTTHGDEFTGYAFRDEARRGLESRSPGLGPAARLRVGPAQGVLGRLVHGFQKKVAVVRCRR